jgi:hypothetical protein
MLVLNGLPGSLEFSHQPLDRVCLMDRLVLGILKNYVEFTIMKPIILKTKDFSPWDHSLDDYYSRDVMRGISGKSLCRSTE